MKGYQLTFFTQQDRKHDHLPLGEWLVQEARKLRIGGATLIVATEGFGHDHRLHSAHFFELTDQPIEVTMAVKFVSCFVPLAAKVSTRLREVGGVIS